MHTDFSIMGTPLYQLCILFCFMSFSDIHFCHFPQIPQTAAYLLSVCLYIIFEFPHILHRIVSFFFFAIDLISFTKIVLLFILYHKNAQKSRDSIKKSETKIFRPGYFQSNLIIFGFMIVALLLYIRLIICIMYSLLVFA